MSSTLTPITCDIKVNKMYYHLELTSKLTIIDAESGTGKTLLLNLIRENQDTRIQCPVPVIPITTNSNFTEGNIYILDEDAEVLRKDKLALTISLMSTVDAYFIIMSRERKLSWLPYSVDDIYTLTLTGGVLRLRKKYPQLYTHNRPLRIESVLTEDETTGLDFFKKIYSNAETTRGKDNVPQMVSDYKNVLVIFDRCGFGSVIKDFLIAIRYRKDVQILDYESFEAFLLEYMGFNLHAEFEYNKENYYTNYLSNLLRKYTKDRNCPCILDCIHCSEYECNYRKEIPNANRVLRSSHYYKFIGGF